MKDVREIMRLRAQAIGVRIGDDPKSPGDFAVICSQHRVIGRRLTLLQARQLETAHVSSHDAT